MMLTMRNQKAGRQTRLRDFITALAGAAGLLLAFAAGEPAVADAPSSQNHLAGTVPAGQSCTYTVTFSDGGFAYAEVKPTVPTDGLQLFVFDSDGALVTDGAASNIDVDDGDPICCWVALTAQPYTVEVVNNSGQDVAYDFITNGTVAEVGQDTIQH